MPEITIRTNARRVARNIRYLKNHSAEAQEASLREVAENIVEIMSEEAPEHDGPVEWHSRDQQIAFHASNGFGQGIPTERTHKHPAGWKIRDVKGGSQVYNSVPGSKYLYGSARGEDFQQRFHAGRHPHFRDEVDGQVELLPKTLIRHMYRIVRRREVAPESENA